jgi:hypothetical protein
MPQSSCAPAAARTALFILDRTEDGGSGGVIASELYGLNNLAELHHQDGFCYMGAPNSEARYGL